MEEDEVHAGEEDNLTEQEVEDQEEARLQQQDYQKSQGWRG